MDKNGRMGLFFIDIDCNRSKDVQSLRDVARLLRNVAAQVEELDRRGKGRSNIVEPITSNDGTEVGEFEWLVDEDDDDEFEYKLTNRLVNLVESVEKFLDKR